jgi:hypothetical protein
LKQTLSRKRSPFQTFNCFAQFKSFKETKRGLRHSGILERSTLVGSNCSSLAFAEKVKSELGVKAMHREIAQAGGTYALREPGGAYTGEFDSESDALKAENTLPWQRIAETAET